jgi:hypothetical protein
MVQCDFCAAMQYDVTWCCPVCGIGSVLCGVLTLTPTSVTSLPLFISFSLLSPQEYHWLAQIQATFAMYSQLGIVGSEIEDMKVLLLRSPSESDSSPDVGTILNTHDSFSCTLHSYWDLI